MFHASTVPHLPVKWFCLWSITFIAGFVCCFFFGNLLTFVRVRRSQFSTRNLCLIAIVFILGSSDNCPAAATVGEASEVLASQRKQISTLTVEYNVETQALVDMDTLKSLEGITYLEEYYVKQYWKNGKWCTLIRHKNGQAAGDRQMSAYVYDGGGIIIEKIFNSDRDTPLRTPREYRRFPLSLQDAAVQAIYSYSVGFLPFPPIPGSQKALTDSDVPRIISSMERGKELAVQQQNGQSFVRIEHAGNIFYLDDQRGFAVKRQEKFENGVLRYIVDNKDFDESVPGIWLPKTVEWSMFAAPSAPEALRGKILTLKRVKILNLQVNGDINDSSVSAKIPARSQVLDFTVQPLNDRGEPINREKSPAVVAYREPANPEDLNAVVRKAQEAVGHSLVTKTGVRRLQIFVAIGLFVIVLSGLIVRYWLRRRVSRGT